MRKCLKSYLNSCRIQEFLVSFNKLRLNSRITTFRQLSRATTFRKLSWGPTHISQTHSHFATGFCHFESLRNVENPLTFRNGFLPSPKFAKNAIKFFADEDISLDITLFFNEKWRDYSKIMIKVKDLNSYHEIQVK